MKVAIIGAGISGLSSALELKSLGVVPTIFERKSIIGQDLNLPVLTLRMFERTFICILKYFKKKYNLEITPLYRLKKETMISPNKQFTVAGNLGYIFKRGEDNYSLESQLASKVNLPIIFDSYIEIKDIKNNFDYIIVSTGDNKIAKELGIWKPTFNAFTRIATVIGNFNTSSVKMWLNTKYAKNSFCFFAATSPHQAYIALTIDNITHNELNHYWDEFLLTEKISYKIVNIMDHEQNIGYTESSNPNNIYFTGNPSGTIDTALGFGSFNAMESGIFAARSIVNKADYVKLMKPVLENVRKIDEFRLTINSFDNNAYNMLLSVLGFPVIKQIIYNCPLTKAKYLALIAQVYNKFNSKS
jgi:digeranylgeranylglycerophospholipid reductase